jgi:hypothetical protein
MSAIVCLILGGTACASDSCETITSEVSAINTEIETERFILSPIKQIHKQSGPAVSFPLRAVTEPLGSFSRSLEKIRLEFFAQVQGTNKSKCYASILGGFV